MALGGFHEREWWEAELRRYGCKPAIGVPKTRTGEWWRWPWPHSYPFHVPVIGPEGRCDVWAFQRVLSDMAKLAPDDWRFPD